MKAVGIIPARYASTRLEGKVLLSIAGKPMIQHVYERASQSSFLGEILVATDDERVAEAVRGFGGEVRLTSPRHASGTDRVAEVATQLSAGLIVNIQGDEPLISPSMIEDALRPLLEDSRVKMSTLCRRITEAEEVFDPNVVKVVMDQGGFALYFSRAPIPFHRDLWGRDPSPRQGARLDLAYKHFGLYAYRRDFLLRFSALPPSPLERIEQLEQLRALENGFPIRVVETEEETIGVDTEEDLQRVRAFFARQGRLGH
ncbi:MAG: 3-deoxy-manno-octulosonate cytidylyltransferase [candidate division NC10 bacterium]|nr:3-deoxy-manno-octulosonate cytidylyltransferase [candidate division NC10 bacterium]